MTNKTILYENTALEVEIIEDFQANIRNIGSSAAVNIEWEIKFQAPFLFILPIKLNGNIDILQNQDVITIPPNPNIFIVGFGTLKQVVTVSADNANTVMDAEIIGFLFGTFIIIL